MKTMQVEFANRTNKILRGTVTLPTEHTTKAILINLHGFSGTRGGFKGAHVHLARALSKIGCGCVRFDFFGNGESDGEFEEMLFSTLLNDTQDILQWVTRQEWAKGLKLILSGQSLGGYIAASMAPICKPYALVLMCPGAGMWYGADKRSLEMIKNGVMFGDIDGLKFSHEFNFDMVKYPDPFTHAKGYNGKVIIIRGTSDALVDTETCEKYKSVYDNASIKLIENADHNFSSLASRAKCESAICEFVQEIY